MNTDFAENIPSSNSEGVATFEAHIKGALNEVFVPISIKNALDKQ